MKKLLSILLAGILSISLAHAEIMENVSGAAGNIPSLPVPVIDGGTGATTNGGALDNLFGGLTNQFGGLNITRSGVATYTVTPDYQVWGVCSLLNFDPTFTSEGASAQQLSWQNWLDDCQLKGLRMGGANKANLINPGGMVAITSGISTFSLTHTTPYIIPNYVLPSWNIVEVRQGTGGSAKYNWNGDPSTQQLKLLQRPMIVMPPHTTSPGLLRIVANSAGTDGGSGWVYGKTYRPGAMQIGDAAGSGFAGGESCTVQNPDSIATATKTSFTCKTASAGACTELAYPTSLTTNGATAAGNPTLNFAASGTSCAVGQQIFDITTPSAISANTVVSASSATTVTMSFNAAGAGVGNGDIIHCNNTQFSSATGQFYLPAFQRRQQWAVDMYFLGSKAGNACNTCATTTCTSNELAAGKFNDCFDGHDTKHAQTFETPNHFTGNTHTTTTIDGISSTAGWNTGDNVAGPGIPAGATISSKTSTSIVISAAATATATGVALEETGMGYVTTCGGAGTGLVVKLQDWPDWCSGSAADADSVSCATNTGGLNGTNTYDALFGNYSASTGYINQIYEEQSRQNFDSIAGYTWGGLADAAELTIGYAQTHLSHYGLVILGSDVVVGHHNDVGSSAQLKLRGGGSITVMEAREDTPTDSINSDAHAIEVDTCKNCAVNNGTYFHNTNSAADVGTLSANYIRLGSDAASTSSTENADVILRGAVYSDGTSGVSLTALGCAFTRGSTIDLNVSNIGTAGSTRAQQFTLFSAYGSNCENSNRIYGSIDNQAGAISSGSFSGAQNVWQAAIQAYVNGFTATQNKTFQISGTLAVANDLTNWVIMPAAGSWSKFYAVCKTGPTTTSAIFDIQKSTNNGSSFTSIWNSTPANKITVAASAVAGTTTSFDTATFSAGDVFRIDVDQVGSGTAGANCTVMGVANY